MAGLGRWGCVARQVVRRRVVAASRYAWTGRRSWRGVESWTARKRRWRQPRGSSPSLLTEVIAANGKAFASSVSRNRLGRREATSSCRSQGYRSGEHGDYRRRRPPMRAVHASARVRRPGSLAATASYPRAPRVGSRRGLPRPAQHPSNVRITRLGPCKEQNRSVAALLQRGAPHSALSLEKPCGIPQNTGPKGIS